MSASIAIAIMAAGAASRFGSCKHLAPLANTTMLEHIIDQCRCASSAPIVVITGCYHQAISAALPSIECYYHAQWRAGLGQSIAFACTTLQRYDRIAIVLGDQAALTANDIARLIDASESHTTSCASINGRLSVPAVFPRYHYAELQRLTGDTGAKTVLAVSSSLCAVEMPNAAIDIDRPSDFDKLPS